MSSVEQEIKAVIAPLAHVDAGEIDAGRWLTAYDIDSLALLVVRESIEKSLEVFISDDRWLDFRSIAELVAYVERERGEREELEAAPKSATASGLPPGGLRLSGGRSLTSKGVLHDEIEIGMPFTGLMNLTESPLLKYLGDLRWAHISAICGTPSKAVADVDGNRLYPTFFYAETAFPEARPMASYGENDVVKVACTMRRYGGSMLDGVAYLLPSDASLSEEAPFDGVDDAVAAGVPAVRLSNIFVMQYTGAQWLKKSRPANPGFERIAELAAAPDAYVLVKQAEKDGCFGQPGPEYVRMAEKPLRAEYPLVADRDLNGAGLVYFANYPVFLDICEREVLGRTPLSLTPELIDRRTIVRRRSAYLNNASSRDVISVEVDPWVYHPGFADHPAPEMAPIRLFINYRMTRKSDGRLMMVSTAEKLIFGCPFEEAPFAEELLRMKPA